MDKIQESTQLEEILAEWALDKQNNGYDPVTCSVSDTINLGALGANVGVSLSGPYTYTASPNVYTIGPGNTTTTWSVPSGNVPWLQAGSTSAKINLTGENADIVVNDWSLVAAVKRIEERLGLFQPNPDLEAEWEDLRELGEKYRQLEQHIKDKQATWDRLKAMPAPDID